jgi:hypothetical protein
LKIYILLLYDFQWVFNRRPTEDEVFSIFERDIPHELGAAQGCPDDKWGTALCCRIEEESVEVLP